MGTKSIREIVEAAASAHLSAQGITGYQILPGMNLAIIDPPFVVASVEAVSNIPDIPEGLGNYLVTLTVQIMTPTGDPGTEATVLAAHRAVTEKVASALDDQSGLAAVFASQGDASLYDITFGTMSDGRAERYLGTTINYEVECVLAG
jgi:hypothetical protein